MMNPWVGAAGWCGGDVIEGGAGAADRGPRRRQFQRAGPRKPHQEQVRQILRCHAHQEGVHGKESAGDERDVEIQGAEIFPFDGGGVFAAAGRRCQHAQVLGSRRPCQEHTREGQGQATHRQSREHLHRHGPDRRSLQRMDLQVNLSTRVRQFLHFLCARGFASMSSISCLRRSRVVRGGSSPTSRHTSSGWLRCAQKGGALIEAEELLHVIVFHIRYLHFELMGVVVLSPVSGLLLGHVT